MGHRQVALWSMVSLVLPAACSGICSCVTTLIRGQALCLFTSSQVLPGDSLQVSGQVSWARGSSTYSGHDQRGGHLLLLGVSLEPEARTAVGSLLPYNFHLPLWADWDGFCVHKHHHGTEQGARDRELPVNGEPRGLEVLCGAKSCLYYGPISSLNTSL